MLFDVINSRRARPGPGDDSKRFAHLQHNIHIDIGREEVGWAISAFWRRIFNKPDAFPPEFRQFFLQSSLAVLGEKCRSGFVGITWRWFITAGAIRPWRPRLKEGNRELRQFGVVAPEGGEHVGLRARLQHEVGNWLVITDCSNASNTVKKAAVLAGVANWVPVFTPLAAKCYYGTRPAGVGFRMDPEKTRTTTFSSGI